MAGEPAEPRLLVPVGAHPPAHLGVFSPGQSLPRRLGPQSLGPGLSGCHTHIWPPGGSVFCDDAASLSACLGMTKLWTQWGAALPQHPGGGQSQHHTALSPSLLYCKTRVPGCPAPTGGAPVLGAGERKGALPQAAPGGSWSKKQAPRGDRDASGQNSRMGGTHWTSQAPPKRTWQGCVLVFPRSLEIWIFYGKTPGPHKQELSTAWITAVPPGQGPVRALPQEWPLPPRLLPSRMTLETNARVKGDPPDPSPEAPVPRRPLPPAIPTCPGEGPHPGKTTTHLQMMKLCPRDVVGRVDVIMLGFILGSLLEK